MVLIPFHSNFRLFSSLNSPSIFIYALTCVLQQQRDLMFGFADRIHTGLSRSDERCE